MCTQDYESEVLRPGFLFAPTIIRSVTLEVVQHESPDGVTGMIVA